MRNIYFDYLASTPVDSRVLDKMIPFFSEKYGNPHSRTHIYGWEAEKAIEEARDKIANLINAHSSEIIFTSGATESNNLAIKGSAYFYKNYGKKHIITLKTEHKCVLDSCRYLKEDGFDITYLGVDKNGIVDLNELEKTIRPDTLLISIMTINNEIGVIQPVAEIGEICRKHNVFFHTDAAQAFGKIPLDVKKMKIDMMSISGHKIYAPKGIGVLYVNKNPRVKLKSLISGGGQERGMRSGTLPTPLIVGLGEAAEIAKSEMNLDYQKISTFYHKITNFLLTIPDVFINGSRIENQYYPGCINASFAYIEGESMIASLKGIAISSGSACTSASLEPSYVLHALGIDEDLAHTSIRFSIGKFTTEDDVNYLIDLINISVIRLRDMSPLWEMVQNGIDIKSIKWVH
ncbi:IscS subfamily cysteine desulfurase [Lyticum sinuosum]|uniref:Cysteine desulfurase IscS n=1 Tax=Lyticum sinuosum TaxID=1332059 RepID=A0AAE5AHU4_9RICK|nr:IscS subfamily cysteine desulfurase [Lyticum sinuosum]MDZ5761401.1 Cysteine desulfurase [Lyticum sinuosum]